MKLTRTAGVALAFASVSALVLSGCTSNSSGGAKKVAFIQGVAGDEFYISMQCGIQDAAKAAGYEVTTQGPTKFDPTLQKPILDSVVASRPAAILIAPTDATDMQAPLAAAARAGVKVVLVDTTIDDPSIAVSSVSSDNEGGGAEAFKALQALNPNGGKVLIISTDPGITTVDARIKGFEEAAAKDPKFNYLGVKYSHNEPANAAKLMSAALARDPDIVGVFATNKYSAEGTGTAVRQANKQNQVKMVGFDAGPAQVKQLRDNTVQALIAQQPVKIGSDGFAQAMNALTNRPVTPKIDTGFSVITADNIDTDGAQYVYKSTC